MSTIKFLDNISFKDEGVAITVFENNDITKEIRICFKKDQIMKEHKAPYPISVMTIKGSIEFGVEDKSVTLNTGDVINLDANVVHELKALEESIVRLTLSKNDSIKRVEGVLKL